MYAWSCPFNTRMTYMFGLIALRFDTCIDSIYSLGSLFLMFLALCVNVYVCTHGLVRLIR